MGCAASCVWIDYSGAGDSFESCRAECEQKLHTVDVSELCLTVNRNAWKQYEFVMHRTDPIEAAIEAAHDGCGCLTVEISADGSLANLEVAYSNLDGALELFGKELGYVQIDSPVEPCIVGAVVPIIFGWDAESLIDENNRRHTIHPVYKFIADNHLRKESSIVAKSEIGWSSLNYHFGIMRNGEDGYLVESWEHCLPTGAATEFSFDKAVEEGDIISPDRIKIDDCRLASMYRVDAEQALALKRIATGQDQP